MFKNLFNNKLKAIDLIEKKCQIKYPEHLKLGIKSKGGNLIFQLPDEDYKLLNSLTNFKTENKLEDSIYLIGHLNSGKIKSTFKKIPFARNLNAGKDKYLVFQNNSDRIFLTDNNGVIKQLEITGLINLFEPNNTLTIAQTNNLKLPNGIKFWSNSYGENKVEKSSNQNILIAETHGTYYNSSSRKENIAKLEVQCIIATKDIQYNISSAYEIENSELDKAIEHMLDYRMFYYNLWCLIDCLNLFLNKSKDAEKLKPVINEFNLYEKAKNMLKGQSVSSI